MPNDPHRRHTAQNARGLNDFVTKREAYAGTRRMIDAALYDARQEWNAGYAEHMARYHTPWYVRAWRTITRRGNGNA